MIFDAHIHIGQYYHIRTTPSPLLRFLDGVGVEGFAASSTSICEGNYNKVLREIRGLLRVAPERVMPVLWLLPQMFTDGGLERFLASDIEWRCLKIHPQLHPDVWRPNSEQMRLLLSLALQIQLPILIHTGLFDYCHAGLYQHIIKDFPEVKFILAHGRPANEAIRVLRKCPNAYVDTAFMATEDIVRFCQEGLSDRVLWGTDYPIPRYFYRGRNMKQYYLGLLSHLRESISTDDFIKITQQNYKEVFSAGNTATTLG